MRRSSCFALSLGKFEFRYVNGTRLKSPLSAPAIGPFKTQPLMLPGTRDVISGDAGSIKFDYYIAPSVQNL